MSITSDEVNYLVFRYLQESGFDHSAFLFGYESMIMNKKEFHSNLKPGALVVYLQKALQFMEMEAHIKDDGTEIECCAPFSLITPHVCMKKWKENTQENDEMNIETKEISGHKEIKRDDCIILADHNDQVTACAWNPKDDILATASIDSSVCLYNFTEHSISNHPIKCQHELYNKKNEITTINWDSEGKLLVSGSADGNVKLWNTKGEKYSSLKPISTSIFSAKFSPDSRELLVCGLDPSFYLYSLGNNNECNLDLTSLKLAESSSLSSPLPSDGVLLDCDWCDNNIFSYCYNDGRLITVNMNQDSKNHEVIQHDGHKSEINVLKWNQSIGRMASAGEDQYIKIWSPSSVHSLCDYTNNVTSIYTLEWYDTTLYSGALDGSISVYNTEASTCVKVYNYHKKPVYSLAVSPCGRYLASTSADHHVYIYNTTTQERIRTFVCEGIPFSVDFNSRGDKVAVASSDSKTYIIDLKV
ncbi:hypothetical protein WA158_000540 [Blastocystis sp. Blastoise]